MNAYTKGQVVRVSVPHDPAYFYVTEGVYVEPHHEGDGHVLLVAGPISGEQERTWFSDEEVQAA